MTHHLIEQHADIATALTLLDKWTARTMLKNHQPGLAMGLIYDEQLLWGKGFGVANIESQIPVTLDTRFRIASITKTFTATAIMQLRDAGKLKLDDAVLDYVDWFDLQYPDAPKITIRNLLSHTSGLPRDSARAMWTELDEISSDDFIETTSKRQPTRAPYEAYAYSNLGYSILGHVIESLSGESWADYLQAHILTPLGMDNTFPMPSSDDAQLATGYYQYDENYQRGKVKFFTMGGFSPSANFASNVTDLVKYAEFHLGKKASPVLSQHSLNDMHRVHWLGDSWDHGYGLGISLFRINNWTISGHSGGFPGYLTQFTMNRKNNFGVIVLTNSLASNPFMYVEQAYKLILPEVIKATEAAKADANPAWQAYLGTYLTFGNLLEVIVRNKQLQIVWLEAPALDPIILSPTEDEHVFVLEESGQSNETARFQMSADGKVERLWLRNEYAVPV